MLCLSVVLLILLPTFVSGESGVQGINLKCSFDLNVVCNSETNPSECNAGFMGNEVVKGVTCGNFKCSDDPNVVCNSVTKTCECKPGFKGNGVIKCIEDEMSICHMIGGPDAYISAFNKEQTGVLMPCNNILTKADIVSRAMPSSGRLFIRVTAIVNPAFNARFPAQVFITGLYIELFVRGDTDRPFDLLCNDNGCYGKTSGIHYTQYNGPSKQLNFTVTTNSNNQQVLKIPFYEVEIRFRGEDGSVAITFPPSTLFDQEPALCNKNSDPIDENQDTGTTLGYDTYDNYILFLNQYNIPLLEYESDALCQIIKDGCRPVSAEWEAVNACSVLYTDRAFSECYYNYRNKNNTHILVEYEACRNEVCAGITKPSLCTAIGMSGCTLSQPFATGPCP